MSTHNICLDVDKQYARQSKQFFLDLRLAAGDVFPKAGRKLTRDRINCHNRHFHYTGFLIIPSHQAGQIILIWTQSSLNLL